MKNEEDYTENISLTSLPGGDYFVLVYNVNDLHPQAFAMGENDLAFYHGTNGKTQQGSSVNFVSFTPDQQGRLVTQIENQGKNNIYLRLANLQDKTTDIRIFALGGSTLFQKKVSQQNGFATKIQLEDVASGFYAVYVKSCDATVMQFFTVTNDGIEMQPLQRVEHPVTNTPENQMVVNY